MEDKMSEIRVLFLAKETPSSIRALEYILGTNAIIERAVIRESDKRIEKLCRDNNIPICKEEDLLSEKLNGKINPDYLISFYWKRAKKSTLDIPTLGSINFHPGPLPEARGSGYHAAILGDWGYWGVTAHYMDDTFDTGDIIECRHFDIDNGIVNKDLVKITHDKLYELFMDIFDRMIRMDEFASVEQAQGDYYSLKELEASKYITAADSSADVDRKIRAFWNPPYSGAKTIIAGKEYTVINDEILEWIAKRL